MVVVHMQSLPEERNVAVIWIHLHASNRLHNKRYLAFLTTDFGMNTVMMHVIVVEKLAKWICNMSGP